jgi:cyanophycin synthetase
VLNAADAQVAELAGLCDGGVIFYALDEHNEVLAAHRARGERVAFVRKGMMVLADAAGETALLEVSKLKPATARHPDSLLAAVCAAWALDVSADLICAGLRSFDATPPNKN